MNSTATQAIPIADATAHKSTLEHAIYNATLAQEGVRGSDCPMDTLISLAQVQATIALAESAKKIADSLESAQLGPAYGFWTRGAS